MRTRRKRTGRRTPQEVDALLGRYRQSKLSVAAFCKQEGVAESVVYRWLRQERVKKPAVQLVEVTSPAPAVASCFRVLTPQGYQVEVPVSFDGQALKRLLGALEG